MLFWMLQSRVEKQAFQEGKQGGSTSVVEARFNN